MINTEGHKTESTGKHSIVSRAFNRLVEMDRSDELCLVTAAFCAFGSVLAAQKRNA